MDFGVLTPSLASGSTSFNINGKYDANLGNGDDETCNADNDDIADGKEDIADDDDYDCVLSDTTTPP